MNYARTQKMKTSVRHAGMDSQHNNQVPKDVFVGADLRVRPPDGRPSFDSLRTGAGSPLRDIHVALDSSHPCPTSENLEVLHFAS